MIVYFGLTNALFLLRLSLCGQAGLRRSLYPAVLTGLFIFTAFRYQVGCDWSGYYNQFQSAGDLSTAEALLNRDPLWWLILNRLREYSLPYPLVNVVSALIFFAGLHRMALQQPDPLGFLILSFPVLILNMPMSGLRQACSIGLICFAFTSFTNRQPWRFAGFTLLAAGFHSSALLFLLLLPMTLRIHCTIRLILGLLSLFPIGFWLITGESAQLAADRYIDNGKDAFGAVFRIASLAVTAIGFLIFLRHDWRSKFPQDYQIAVLGAVLILLVSTVLLVSSVIADRFGYYLVPLQLMIFARIPFLRIRATDAVYFLLPYIGLLLIAGIWTAWSGHFRQCYLPYQSWLFGFPQFSPDGV